MSEHARKRRHYERAAALTFEVVGRFKAANPAFRFPPKDVAFLASLLDCGDRLALNSAARELVEQLITESRRRRLDDAPTALMLRASLELHEIPVTHVSFDELGVALVPMPPGGPGVSS